MSRETEGNSYIESYVRRIDIKVNKLEKMLEVIVKKLYGDEKIPELEESKSKPYKKEKKSSSDFSEFIW